MSLENEHPRIHIRRSNTCPEHLALSQEPPVVPARRGALEQKTTDTSIACNQTLPVAMADHHEEPENVNRSWVRRSRHRIGTIIETKKAHITIITLTAIDIILVMLQIGASLLHLDETEEELWYIALFGHLSLAIVCIFMLEILLKFYAFGPRYFWTGTRHGVLHLVDAIIILASFLLEILLHGAAEELGSLLIIFRLWRLVKLTGTVAIEVSEHDEVQVERLEAKIRSLEVELEASRLEVQTLKRYSVYQD
ncbi:hypothetical protein EDD21DRAFT_371854 [Dissophora ornata]|nr:hypothetical protein BGZ58_001819 [Dissophora ornata]KAI8602452.1 hypothetical protein EDD21DRAFT_371854 [Dissophora ornata]